MTTRRKKPIVEGEEITAPEETAPPKKRRVTHRKKTAPAPETDAAGITIPLQPHPEPMPSVMSVTPPVMPVNMKIEPAEMPDEPTMIKPVGRIPVAEDNHAANLWAPPPKNDRDLSAPPKILTTPKSLPSAPVEDILAETEHNDLMEFEHPDLTRTHQAAHSGFFRKLGIGFALVALAVLMFVGYITYSRATVTVYPKKDEVKIEHSIDVVAEPGEKTIGGETVEITVSGERSIVPGSASSTAPAPEAVVDDSNVTYIGVATLTNKTNESVTLVPTTRLLSPDNILFRMKDRQTIPAGGTAKVSIYADKPGPTGALGPTKFTIPGLPIDKQAVIWAETKEPMKSGSGTSAVVAPTTPKATVTQADLDSLKATLQEELLAEAKTELAKKVTGTWTGQEWIPLIVSETPLPAVGEVVDEITLRRTLRVLQVSFDRQKAIDLAAGEIKRSLDTDHELVGIQGDTASIVADAIDTKSGSATLRIGIIGESSISLSSPLFDTEKLRGLDLGAVRAYFSGIPGVDRIDVQFRPFWIKRMPDLKEHIEFKLAK